MRRRLNINVILFIILILQIVSIVKNFTEEKERLEEMGLGVIKSATMTEVEKTEDNMRYFSEYDLNEDYDKKTMYRLDLEVANTGSEPVELDFDLSYIKVESSEGYYFVSEKDWYYGDMEDRPYCEMIPGGTTAVVSYYVLLYTDNFEELRVYPWSGREEYVVIQIQ